MVDGVARAHGTGIDIALIVVHAWASSGDGTGDSEGGVDPSQGVCDDQVATRSRERQFSAVRAGSKLLERVQQDDTAVAA